MNQIRKHPLNVKGKYYVDNDNCTCMGACIDIAPDIFKFDEKIYGSYVAKQPETIEEESLCEEAMVCCAFEAIHDDGK